MTDIVERLRYRIGVIVDLGEWLEGNHELRVEAADEIQRLRAELKTVEADHKSAARLANILDGELAALEKSHADLASKLAASGGERDRLREALQWADEQIGWKGDGPEAQDKFYCEHCTAEPELDSNDITHTAECPTHRIRAALSDTEASGG